MSFPKSEGEPTNRELAQSIQRVEETLSEVLVLLYHVIHQHQEIARAASFDRTVTSRSLGGVPFRNDVHEV
jgi:hypothetical protein